MTKPTNPVDPSRDARHRGFDELRGLVIVLMTLDHVRGFVAPSGANPMDWDTTTVGFFLVRWVTHLCAPTFVFLMGVAASLRARRRPDSTTSFLLTRGMWLIFLEATWVSFSWGWDLGNTYFGVLWALGGSMILLAAIHRLPAQLVFAVGFLLVVGLEVANPQPEPGLVRLMVQPGSFSVLGHAVGCSYPLLPWFGAAAMGWGATDALRSARPQRLALAAGVALTAFVVYRAFLGVDANPWAVQGTASMTIADFLSPSKYPPSVAFYLLTLGAGLAVLAGAHRRTGPIARFVERLGRVPMMFYLLHLPLAHMVGNGYAWLRYGEMRVPASEAVSLPVILGAWVVVVALLAPVCLRWDSLKRRRRDLRWLSYL